MRARKTAFDRHDWRDALSVGLIGEMNKVGEPDPILELRLHGPFRAAWSDGTELRLKGAKQQAFVALVACAPDKVCTRSWLQSMLWGRVDHKLGRASLRQALSALKTEMGRRFDSVFDVDGDQIGFRPGSVRLTGGPDLGQFLDGVDIDEDGFEEWLREMRMSAPVTPASFAMSTSGANAETFLRPKIGVLPFVNYPRDPNHSYLGDAIAQELIRALSRSQMIDMTSHLSSRSFDAQSVDIGGVRRALGVDYLVTGRCLISEGRLLMDVDFHDAVQGNLIWTERFKTHTDKFFDGSADFVTDIALEVVNSVLARSVELGSVRPLPTVATHALMMSAIALMHHMASSNFARALEHLATVSERAPKHSIPRAWTAQWYLLRVFQGWSDDPVSDGKAATDNAAAALDLHPECAFSLGINANVKTMLEGDFDAGERNFDRALELNPSSAITTQLKSLLHVFKGEGAEAVRLSERARALSPVDPRSHFFDGLSATAYLADGQFEKAIDTANRSLRINPRHVSAHRARIIALQMSGRHSEAKVAVDELLRRDPTLTVENYVARHAAARTPLGRDWAKAMGEAGVPER